jgi:AAA15 family ATPase/GTPase
MIVKLFSSQITNKNNAQLIFSSHDTNILDRRFFRRDQIWFTEKNKFGATDLYSLLDYNIDNKKVRNDATYGKNYILGKYGAIPFLGAIYKNIDLISPHIYN